MKSYLQICKNSSAKKFAKFPPKTKFSRRGFEKIEKILGRLCASRGTFQAHPGEERANSRITFPSPIGDKKFKKSLQSAIRGRKLTEALEILSEQGIEGDLAISCISSLNEKMGGM